MNILQMRADSRAIDFPQYSADFSAYSTVPIDLNTDTEVFVPLPPTVKLMVPCGAFLLLNMEDGVKDGTLLIHGQSLPDGFNNAPLKCVHDLNSEPQVRVPDLFQFGPWLDVGIRYYRSSFFDSQAAAKADLQNQLAHISEEMTVKFGATRTMFACYDDKVLFLTDKRTNKQFAELEGWMFGA